MTTEVQMLRLSLLIQKLKLLEVNLEEFGKLIFSYLDHPAFLPNPQLLHLILNGSRLNVVGKYKISIFVF